MSHGYLLGCPKLYPNATKAYPCRASGLVQIANALTEILKSSAFYTVDRQTGKFRVGAGGVGQNILLRMARSIPSKDDSVPHSLSSQSRMYFRMAHAARLFA